MAKQTQAGSRDVPTRNPPWPSRCIVIWESTAQTGTNVASTSRVAMEWQRAVQLNGKPLPASASVRVWDKGERGRVTESLVHDLLLPKDIHVFEDRTDESLGKWLQWHTIAVISCPIAFYLFSHAYICFHTYHHRFIKLRN